MLSLINYNKEYPLIHKSILQKYVQSIHTYFFIDRIQLTSLKIILLTHNSD